MALGGSTHDREVLPVRQDWVPIIYDIDDWKILDYFSSHKTFENKSKLVVG